MSRKASSKVIQGYDVDLAKELGVVTAIIWEKVSFWGTKGERKDGWVYKTYDQMFDETGLKVDAVRAAYNKLKKHELIEIKTMKVDGTPKLHFRLLEFPLSEIQFSIENGNSNNPLYIQESTQETKVANALSTKKQELLALVNKITGRSFRTLPEKGVKKTLDAFSLVEIENSLRRLARDEWHKERLKELSLDYLIRSTTIDKFFKPVNAPGELTPAQLANQRSIDEARAFRMKHGAEG